MYSPPNVDALREAEAAGNVFLVFEEWESGGDGGHAIPVGIFWSVEEALVCYDKTVTDNKALRRQVWGHEDEDDDEVAWDVDVHIEAMRIHGSVLAAKHVRAAIAATFSYLETYHSAKFDGPVTPEVLDRIAALTEVVMRADEKAVTRG